MGRRVEERFWEKVDRGRPDACWPWLASFTIHGYGQFRIGGRETRPEGAHRVAYVLTVGPIPDGLVIDHLCRNRACCNPTHLEAVTPSENTLRGDSPPAINARKRHCPQGHALEGANLVQSKLPRRLCRRCHNDQQARRAAA